jgi:glycine cleavage system aminomethyltransferase T
VGQEVVARLNTYGKVARSLVRLELEDGAPVPAPGAPILHDGTVVGSVTSAARPEGRSRPVALGYVKSREVTAGAATLAVDHGGARLVARLVSG